MGNVLNNLKQTIKPKTRKGLVLAIVFGVISPIIGGVAAGIVINKFFIGKRTDYSKYNADDIKEANDVGLLMEKYKVDDTDYSLTYTPWEIFNVSFALFSSHEYSSSLTIGNADAGIVQQSIRNATIRNKDRYFEEALSKSSMVAVANRTYLNEDSSIYLYRGQTESATIAKYEKVHYEFTTEVYSEAFGKIPSRPSIYIVNKKTVIKKECSTIKNENGYQVNLKLNPNTGVLDYVKQMKSISNLNDFPSFYYVNLTLYTDDQLLVKSMSIEEKYFAAMGGVGTDITARLDITYDVDIEKAIPKVDEVIVYPEVK